MNLKHFIFSIPALLLFGISLLLPVAANSQNVYEDYTFLTFVGPGSAGAGWIDGLGEAARFSSPSGITCDASGNFYVADSHNNTIRKITPDGLVTTVAGLNGFSGSKDGVGAAARFNSPFGIAVDGSGNLYVSDTGNQIIRKISPAGNVTTIAGLAGTSGTTDGTGSNARFNTPDGIALDSSTNLYVADTRNHTIRKITPAGVVSTFAGSAGNQGNADKTGTSASFRNPIGVAVDPTGNVYVADSGNDTIRKITPSGAVSTLAGLAQSIGSADGTNQTARFNQPDALVVDGNNNLYVVDTFNHTLRKVTPEGVVTTLAGGAGIAGAVNATGLAARFNYPIGITLDNNDNLYIAEFSNNSIRKVTLGLVVTTFAGSFGGSGSTDATGSNARFNFPSGIAFGADGNGYVTDLANNMIRKVTPEGVVTTLAGQTTSGTNDGAGNTAQFSNPSALAVDANGNVFVADTANSSIREVTPLGGVTTFAGKTGVLGTNDGTGSAARFNSPFGIVIDTNGNMFVGDTHSHTIRKITTDGVVTTFAGKIAQQGTNDGAALSAGFSFPEGVAVDSDGNLYVADDGNNTIRKITSDGSVSTLVGTAGVTGSSDGTGSAAKFFRPFGLTVDHNGNVYVGDTDNNLIRKITPGGVVTTIGGTAGVSGSLEGSGSDAQFSSPEGVAVDAEGNVYVADAENHTIRKGYPSLPDRPIVDVAAARVGVTRHFSISNLTTTTWSWKVLRQPAGSTAQLSATNISNPTFTPDVEDIYIIQFQGWDNSGHTTIRRVTLMADNTSPTLSITNPASGQFLSNSVITVRGTAADNFGVSNVWVQANGGAWTKASGTTNWSMDLTLVSGANVIRAYAEDAAGNVSTTNEVDVTGVPSAPLAVLIDGGGSVTPNLNGAILEIGRTYSMTAQPGAGCDFVGWTGSLETNSPTISFVMASNLTFTAHFTDPVRPTVTIVSPKKGLSVSNALYVATGTASDNGQLASVWYQLNGGDWVQATNTVNWTAGVAPVSGANTLNVYALDTFNNSSVTNSVTFNYIPSGQMTIIRSGSGAVSPDYNGWFLQLGKSYKMTAQPNFGYLFVNWADGQGNVVSTSPLLQFTVQSNTTYRASFILNPFAALIGPYAGLYYDTNNVTLSNSGFVALTLANDGGFTAKLSPVSGKAVAISGRFTMDGVFSNSVAVKGAAPFLVQLNYDKVNGQIRGTIGQSGWTAQMLVVRAAFSMAVPAPQANKKYTLVIPGSDNSASEPGGNGYGTISVDVAGNLSFSGALGDGTKAAQKTFLGKQSQWPFWISPYKGQGAIFGWLNFTNGANSDLGGTVYWLRQPQTKAKLYPNGFSFPDGVEVVGSLYSFTNGTPLLNLPSGGTAVLQQGNLPQSFTNHFSLGSDNKPTSSDGLSLKLTTASGLFSGSARNSDNGKSVPINGVLLQKQNSAFGLFLGTGQSGAVYLGQ